MRLALALAALAAPATSPATAQDAPPAIVVAYACEGGAGLQVAYLNPPGGGAFAVVLHDGELVPMQAGPSGSGVRYVSIGAERLVWHTKGDFGFLARDDAGETTVLDECNATGG